MANNQYETLGGREARFVPAIDFHNFHRGQFPPQPWERSQLLRESFSLAFRSTVWVSGEDKAKNQQIMADYMGDEGTAMVRKSKWHPQTAVEIFLPLFEFRVITRHFAVHSIGRALVARAEEGFLPELYKAHFDEVKLGPIYKNSLHFLTPINRQSPGN